VAVSLVVGGLVWFRLVEPWVSPFDACTEPVWRLDLAHLSDVGLCRRYLGR